MLRTRAAGIALALVFFQSCAHNPDRARRAYLTRGQDFYSVGSYADAEIQFRKALQQDARFGEAWLWLGRAEERLGRYAPAFDAFSRAVAMMPDQEPPKAALGNFLLVAYLGNSAHPGDLYQQIAALSDQLLAHNRKSFDGIRFKAYLLLSDKNPDAAAQYFEEADRLKPNQPDIATALCESLFQAEKKEEAERVALLYLKKNPSYGPIYTMLYQYYRGADRNAEADAMLRRKVDANPREGRYRIELARHYTQTGRSAEASGLLKQLADDTKQFPHGALEAGDFYRDAHDLTRAKQYYLQGSQTDSGIKTTYWKRLVQTDLAGNDRRAAREMLDQILKAVPGDPEALASSAALRESDNDPAQRDLALAEFKALVEKVPDQADYRLQYASALRLAGRGEEARGQFTLVLQRQPGSITALRALADLSIRTQRFDDALSNADRLLALQPGDPAATLVRSAALAAKGRLPETHSILTELASRHPELREAQLQLALLDIEEKHVGEAEARLRKLYSPGKGDIRSLKGLVEVYRAQGRLDRAVLLLQEDLAQGDQSHEVRALLAQTAMQAGDRSLANAQYEQLANLEPKSLKVAIDLGLARESNGDLPGAVSAFQRAREITPKSPLPYAYLGRALDEEGKHAEAAASYRQSLTLDSRNPWVMNNLAYLLAETGGDLKEAMDLARDASHADPNNRAFSDTVGWVYLKEKDVPSALHIFQSLSAREPGDVNLRLHLSEALLASGDRNHARSELRAALNLRSTPAERIAVEKLLKRSESD